MTDILDDSHEGELTNEEHEALLLMCGHAIGPPLSHGAQAVMDAARKYRTQAWSSGTHQRFTKSIVAALRAAANEVIPVPIKARTPDEHWALLGVKNKLLAIADELETL